VDRISIEIVDDFEVVRHGLRLSLELESDMVIVGEARTGQEAIEVARKVTPDVILLDVRLGDLDGPEVCRQVLAVSPRTAVVMLTNYAQDDLVFRSLVAGAKGYIIKDVELDELKKIIRSVHKGNAVLDPRVTNPLISTVTSTSASRQMHHRSTSLSQTDLAIIRHLSKGLTNQEIAKRVHLSPHTVKDHVERLCTLFGVHSRLAMVSEAFKRGLL
jgi:DNA-binding NarL/FixJ family response regulator